MSLRTIKEQLLQGRLKGFKVGRLWRMRESDMEAFTQTIAPQRPPS